MPHQCIKCGSLFAQADATIAHGCPSCGNKVFYYTKKALGTRKPLTELAHLDEDVRTLISDETAGERPVDLDVETIRVLEPGRYELDLARMLAGKQPVISRLAEGKFEIELEGKKARHRP